jgi:hypothetical protein
LHDLDCKGSQAGAAKVRQDVCWEAQIHFLHFCWWFFRSLLPAVDGAVTTQYSAGMADAAALL